jgi:glycosyltransferase involved in cell wall biosynthesis
MPKLSIITINYNNRIGLIDTVSSIQDQVFRDFENIIIDGGSSDGSSEWINKNSNLFSYFVIEKDNGIYDAMNKGIKEASGEYCLFLNSGDRFYDEASLVRFWDAYQKKVGTRNDFSIIYTDVITHYNGKMPEVKKYLDELSKFYLCIEIINHQSQFIKTEMLRKIGGYDLKYKLASDYELFLRLLYLEKVKYLHIPVIVSKYNMVGTSSSVETGNKYQLERDEIRSLYFPEELQRAKIIDFFQTSSDYLLVNRDDLALRLVIVVTRKFLILATSSGFVSKVFRNILVISYRFFNLLRFRLS